MFVFVRMIDVACWVRLEQRGGHWQTAVLRLGSPNSEDGRPRHLPEEAIYSFDSKITGRRGSLKACRRGSGQVRKSMQAFEA